jgi:hypothetical protein
MVDVVAEVLATDAAGQPVGAILTSIDSSESDNGTGDGNTVNDIQQADMGSADFEFQLRAERAGGGPGRVYTVVYTATDSFGNQTSAAAFATVPHDQDGMVEPLEIHLQDGPAGTSLSWSEVDDAVSYDVIRGELTNVVLAGLVINLGSVVCLERDSSDASSVGDEDRELPEPGRAFFYLVEYDDGTSSSYGSESAGLPRAPAQGDCE